ncbi:MAG: ATP-binding protein [Methylophilaceae bacterium]|nr:ATP-binding protein [Methyloradius sp.]
MTQERNPWVSRFEHLLDPEEIRRRAMYIPDELPDISLLSHDAAKIKLQEILEQVFVPTQQNVAILHYWVEVIVTHCKTYYPSPQALCRHIYSKPPLPKFTRLMGLTGLAGVGKTELVQAFKRILPQEQRHNLRVDEYHTGMSLLNPWISIVDENSSAKLILDSFWGEEHSLRNSIKLLRKHGYINGVPMVIVDELQFLTLSSTANAKLMELLLSVGQLGLPCLYSANYSLIHRLAKRPQEDRDRMLSNLTCLHPDPPNSEDWIKTLDTFLRLFPEVFRFDANDDAAAIHWYCAGIKRGLVELLTIAYGISRNFSGKVTIKEIELAYASPRFSAKRQDVEIIHRQIIENRKVKNDLWCPIDLPNPFGEIQKQSLIQRQLENEHLKKLELTFSREEQNKIKAITKANQPQNKVVLIKKTPLSAEKLLEDANWFQDSFEK